MPVTFNLHRALVRLTYSAGHEQRPPLVSGFDEIGNLKTDAEINPGNSGGGAFDDFDTFLGMPSFIFTDERGKLGFVITVDRIREWLGTALKGGIPDSSQSVSTAFEPSNL